MLAEENEAVLRLDFEAVLIVSKMKRRKYNSSLVAYSFRSV